MRTSTLAQWQTEVAQLLKGNRRGLLFEEITKSCGKPPCPKSVSCLASGPFRFYSHFDRKAWDFRYLLSSR